jgi:hypothetical protein
LVETRGQWFAGVANPHHYSQRRALADAVPESTLRRPHTEVLNEVANWRSLLDLSAPAH